MKEWPITINCTMLLVLPDKIFSRNSFLGVKNQHNLVGHARQHNLVYKRMDYAGICSSQTSQIRRIQEHFEA